MQFSDVRKELVQCGRDSCVTWLGKYELRNLRVKSLEKSIQLKHNKIGHTIVL